MFIEKAIKVHGIIYDYSLVKYINAKTNVTIICNEHGPFEQRPDNHLQKKGCQKCAGNEKYTTEEIIKKFNEVHKFEYRYNQLVYIEIFSKVQIECLVHGDFWQTAKSHLSGSRCPKCIGRNLSREDIIEILNKVHDNFYDYSESIFKRAKDKITIKCEEHGPFNQALDDHKSGKGCPKCRKSKGEKLVSRFLEIKQINYSEQKTFDLCRNPKTNKLLLFDFYLPNSNICIEFDGIQHYKPMRFSKNSKSSLKDIKYRDEIKNIFCKENNIKLIRISYKDISKISELLTELLGGYFAN